MRHNGDISIAGNLILDGATSTVQNLYIEQFTQTQETQLASTLTTANYGRIILNKTVGALKFWAGDSFVQIGGTGDAATVATQLATLQSSLGEFIMSDGTFNIGAFSALSGINVPVDASDLTAVFTAIDTALKNVANASIELAGLADTNIDNPTTGDTLKYDADQAVWINQSLSPTDLTGVTVLASELNQLSGMDGNVSDALASNTDAIHTLADTVADVQQTANDTNALAANSATVLGATTDSVGLNADGTFIPLTGTVYIANATDITTGLKLIDSQLSYVTSTVQGHALNSRITTTFEDQTQIEVDHNLGTMYISVICVDSNNTTIPGTTVTYTSANSLTVNLPATNTGTIVIISPNILG